MSEREVVNEDGVRVITPRNMLREKIGYGGIDPVLLERAEEVISNSDQDVDYANYSRYFLNRIEEIIAAARKPGRDDREIITSLTRPVMDMKASGGMFGYALVSEIADVVLDFLEGLDKLNDDAIDIFEIHHKALSAIISNGLKGDGGKNGLGLSKELFGACQRYYKKYPDAKKN